jgi:hypothetical protein
MSFGLSLDDALDDDKSNVFLDASPPTLSCSDDSTELLLLTLLLLLLLLFKPAMTAAAAVFGCVGTAAVTAEELLGLLKGGVIFRGEGDELGAVAAPGLVVPASCRNRCE